MRLRAVSVETAGWRWAILRSDLSATDRHVALTLATLMNTDGTIPAKHARSVETIAGNSGRKPATIIQATQSLKRAGWLIIRPGRGRRVNQYIAAMPGEALLRDEANRVKPAKRSNVVVPLRPVVMPLQARSRASEGNQPARQHFPAPADSLNHSECDHAPEDSEGYCTKCKTWRSERNIA